MTAAFKGTTELLRRVTAFLLIGVVRGYQIFISPLLGPRCRFTPTCSNYFIGAVRKHGPLKGAMLGCWRVCRCHPWSRGGHDPP